MQGSSIDWHPKEKQPGHSATCFDFSSLFRSARIGPKTVSIDRARWSLSFCFWGDQGSRSLRRPIDEPRRFKSLSFFFVLIESPLHTAPTPGGTFFCLEGVRIRVHHPTPTRVAHSVIDVDSCRHTGQNESARSGRDSMSRTMHIRAHTHTRHRNVGSGITGPRFRDPGLGSWIPGPGSGRGFRDLGTRVQDSGIRTTDPVQISCPLPRYRDPKPRTRNPGARDHRSQTRDPGSHIRIPDPGTGAPGPETQ